MTVNQYEHHAEQMEAARRDFAKNFQHVPPCAEMAAWQEFLRERGLSKQCAVWATLIFAML